MEYIYCYETIVLYLLYHICFFSSISLCTVLLNRALYKFGIILLCVWWRSFGRKAGCCDEHWSWTDGAILTVTVGVDGSVKNGLYCQGPGVAQYFAPDAVLCPVKMAAFTGHIWNNISRSFPRSSLEVHHHCLQFEVIICCSNVADYGTIIIGWFAGHYCI